MQGSLAVVSQSGQTLSFFDLASGERTAHLTDMIGEPHELCYDKQRNLLYLSHTYRHGHYWDHGDYAHEISLIDCSTRTIVGMIDVAPAGGPHGLYMNEAQDVLYASVEELEAGMPGGVIAIDLKTRKIVKRIPSESKPHWFIMTPDSRKAYTCNKSEPHISIVDLERGTFTGKIEVESTEEPTMSPDGKFAYFPTPSATIGQNPKNPRILVIDTTTDEIVKSIPLDKGVFSIHATPLGSIMAGKYWMEPGKPPSANPGHLALVSPDTGLVFGETLTDSPSLTLRSSPDGKIGFVANILKGTVSVVDLESMEVMKTLTVDTERNPSKKGHQGAHGLALVP